MDTPQDIVVQLAAHKNIVGIKCTDGNVGKAAYVCSKTDPKQFTLMSGSADSFLPFLSIGAQGCVPGLGNVVPRAVVRLFELYNNNSDDQWEETQRLQGILGGPDHALFRLNGISSVKSVMQSVLGYGGLPRAPLLPTPPELQEKILNIMEPALALERQLASKSSSK
jgi:L-threo-3-deoxy-hexylosonate aldolase